MPIRTVIVDDEPLALEELAFQLASFDDISVIGQGSNGLEAVELIESLQPDLVMLDIQMPGMDGFQVVRKVTDRAAHVPNVVFVTAYDQYALSAFEVSAVDYLLKPIDEASLDRAIQRVRQQPQSDQDVRKQLADLIRSIEPHHEHGRSHRITIKKGSRIILTDVADIIFAHIQEGVVFVVTEEIEGMTSYRTLEELLQDLNSQIFWRVHRSYIANIDRVSEVIPWFSGTYRLVMDDEGRHEIPLSRTQAKKLRKVLKW